MQAGTYALKQKIHTADRMTLDFMEGEFFIEDPNYFWKGNLLYQLFEQAHTPWDCMIDAIVNGKATLFLAVKDDTIFSYLFCGEFEKIAIGWSQVNVEEYEKKSFHRGILLNGKLLSITKRKVLTFILLAKAILGIKFFILPQQMTNLLVVRLKSGMVGLCYQ